MFIRVAALFLAISAFGAYATEPSPVDPHVSDVLGIRIVDGDTIHLPGRKENTRIVGLNAPELYHPHCPTELALAVEATNRLQSLMDGADDIQASQVPCSCPAGSEGTLRCNWGRSCAVLTINHVDVAHTLVADGLAVPFTCGTTRCPKTPRPWCN